MALIERKWILERMELWETQLRYHRNNREDMSLPETMVVWRDEEDDE